VARIDSRGRNIENSERIQKKGRNIENSERIQKKGEKGSSEGKRRADARDKTLISDTLIPDY
jgi:hypothetical protein